MLHSTSGLTRTKINGIGYLVCEGNSFYGEGCLENRTMRKIRRGPDNRK